MATWVAPRQPGLTRRDTTIAVGVFALAVGIWALRWRGVDYPAQIYRVDLVRRHGLSLWNANWYGGHHTPGYGIVFDSSGFPGVGERLNQLQREGDHAAMAAAITDEMLDAFAVTATWDDLPQALLDRYGDRAADIVCYSVLEHWNDDPGSLERWQDVNRRFSELLGGTPHA